ncbi:hypothetical protein AB0G05_13835 [Nonomuraea wenchangensis]
METVSHHDSTDDGRTAVLVDISDIIVSEESVSALQGRQLWMRPERDVGH